MARLRVNTKQDKSNPEFKVSFKEAKHTREAKKYKKFLKFSIALNIILSIISIACLF